MPFGLVEIVSEWGRMGE